jgi:hypothetical protein
VGLPHLGSAPDVVGLSGKRLKSGHLYNGPSPSGERVPFAVLACGGAPAAVSGHCYAWRPTAHPGLAGLRRAAGINAAGIVVQALVRRLGP